MSEDKNLKNEQEEKISLEDVVLDEVKIDNKKEEVKETKVKKEKKDNKGFNKNIIISAVLCVLCLGLGYTIGKDAGRKLPATSKSYSSSKVYATVGESEITGKQLAYKMEPMFFLNAKKEMTEEEITAYEASMIDYMTTTEALYLAGVEDGVEVTDEEIENEYMMLMTQIPQAFGLDEEGFLKEFDLDKEYVKSELKKELIAMKYMAEVTNVTDEEAENYYDKNKDEFLKVEASHILISNLDDAQQEVSDEEKEKNKEEAEKILERVNSGEDFASLAKEYSDDNSAEKGGKLDLFGKGVMVPEFEEEAFSLEVGKTSDELVETDYGYHIVKKTDEKYDEFDTVKEDLKTKLSYDKQNNIIDELFEKYGVENQLEKELNEK